MRYVTEIRFARFENGRIVNYPPGSQIELSEKETEVFAAGTLKLVLGNTTTLTSVNNTFSPDTVSIHTRSKK